MSNDIILLTVEDVSLSFVQSKESVVKALNHVSFMVKRGEIFGLVGESGSGKSTMGRAIARLVRPQSGSIRLEGKELTRKMSTKERKISAKDVQMIFQDPMSALNPKWTVMQMLLEPLNIHQNSLSSAEKQSAVFAMMEEVGLNPAYANRYVHEFSGGQRQRISIARALMNRPKLLICDESIAALDLSIQAQIVNLLKKLRKEFDLSMIFISHDLAMVNYISDRIGVIYKGDLVEMGDADQVYHHPQHAYTKSLLNAIPKVAFT
ncbi:ATP-binding cassette domain-containing protein [Entomospira culicis]|uniref:ABC transporter ATP-binding protein n=1 Tax=Entomospira culicis TaxID=2719989 RepID=A0A968KVH4_9SPIO|nr:ABC transporter ATP-binding protein [Entomospira culicis]NIZ19898.1 ABC transporter ATP-binding protein [Entomospira culicis]NIZ70145.1 ABC transporter ATP-binding protein [Entomospira culicis]WDI38072.1 ABC transporter ATP-binding protein [Entomospira culicis]WDI39695.1 ABC transporter ATP-binding protein [Entomospira culicis]